MALDGKHHLEGILQPPGTFRVFLYDAYTHPVSPEELRQAGGKVQWGEAEGSPETPLRLSADGSALETALGREVMFPLTLTLWLHLPGTPEGSKPELFTFPFSHYTH